MNLADLFGRLLSRLLTVPRGKTERDEAAFSLHTPQL